MKLTLGLLAGLGLSIFACAQSLVLPDEVQIEGCQIDDLNPQTLTAAITVVSPGGPLQVTGFPDLHGWIIEPAVSGFATPGGTDFLFTTNTSRLSYGTQKTFVAFAVQGSAEVAGIVVVSVTCTPTPTLAIPAPYDKLNITMTAGSAPQSYTIPIAGDSNATRDEITFTLNREAAGFANPWITSAAGLDGTPDRGSVRKGGQSSFRIVVDPRNLTAQDAPYVGFVHVKDTTAQIGSADLTVRLTVQPGAGGDLLVPATPVDLTATLGDATVGAQNVHIDSSGQPLAFTATPGTDAGWLLLNGGSSPVSGSTPMDLQVSANLTGLKVGGYSGSIQLASGQSSATVNVTLTINAPSQLPAIAANGVLTGAATQAPLSPGAWAAVKGTNLAPDTSPAGGRTWEAREIVGDVLPTVLDGIRVTVDGKPAVIYFVSNGQLNFQVPPDASTGTNIPITVTTSKGTSAVATAAVQTYSPVLFPYYGTPYVIAQHPDSTVVGRGSLKPAKPGEILALYGTGFGPTDPPTPSGVVVRRYAKLAQPVTVHIAGVVAETQAALLIGVGLYQFNVVVPAALPDGDYPVTMEIGGTRTQGGLMLPVQR